MDEDYTAPAMVLPVNPLENPEWDAHLVKYEDCSFFHGVAWAKVLADSYGFKPFYFATSRALLPLMEVDSWLTGRRGIGLPFTDACGAVVPKGESQESVNALFKNAIEFGRHRGWKYLECRDARKWFPDPAASLSYYRHHVHLTPDESAMFKNLADAVRRAIRKAQKHGLTITVSRSLDATRRFYLLQCKTRRRHGLPPQPFAFFLNIHKHILSQKRGVIVTAAQGNRPVAAAVYFQWGRQAIYKFGASDDALQLLRGANLVMWEAMKWLAGNGVISLHLGKTALSNQGLRRFKLGWGAVEERIDYLKYDLRQNRFVCDTDAIAGWHNHLFRALPLFASRMAGRILYKHWA